jgi:MFS family permease
MTNLFLLCLCCGCWAFGFGLECPLASRWLQEAGYSEQFIGLNTGAHFLGVVLLGAFAPSLMRRNGRAVIGIGLLLSGAGVAAFPWGNGPAGWFVLRIVAGAGGALAMIGLETLINLNSPPESRGRHFAFYACSVGLGFAVGAFLGLHLFAVSPERSFLVGGAVTLLAAPAVSLLPRFPIQLRAPKSAAPLLASVLSLGSAWAQGFLEAGMLGLLPLYLKTIGMNDGASGNLLGVILIGVLVCQMPIGCLADRLGRERVLVGCFVVVGIGLAIAPVAEPDIGLPVALFVIGVFSGAFYPLGLALLGERLPTTEIPRANAWFLSVNCLGSFVSTPLTGFIMKQTGQRAMFWTGEIVVVLVLVIWCFWRLKAQKPLRARIATRLPPTSRHESAL